MSGAELDEVPDEWSSSQLEEIEESSITPKMLSRHDGVEAPTGASTAEKEG